MNFKSLFAGVIFSLASVGSNAQTLIVPGSANVWLAGMPDGATASADRAPEQAPVLFDLPNLGAGGYLTFSATGSTAQGPGYSLTGPDGGSVTGHSYGTENGIAASTLPFMGLVGVFLSDQQPNLTPAPAALNFSVIGKDFTSFSAQLKQPFFIGDGTTSGGAAQLFYVPASATRLFLGTADAWGWYNNVGQLTVNVSAVPTPANVLVMLMGLGVLAFMRRYARVNSG